MGNLIDALVDPQNLIAAFSALAVFATLLTILMPFLQQDELSARVKSAVTDREKIRQRERARLAADKKKGSLKQENSGSIKDLVDRLNLKKALADENTFMNLTMAGYRKQSHIYVFLFFRTVMPLLLLIVGAIYFFGISETERPMGVKFSFSLAAAGVGFYLPNLFVKSQVQKRQQSIRMAWPDALDLMLICVESGMSLEAAFQKVAGEIGLQSPPLAEELVLVTAELSYLQERKTAFENLANRTGLEGVKNVSMALIQAERYGTPLGSALRVLAQENRDARMALAEKKAAALPPKLTVPMIVFFLPVLFAVIMGPAMIQIFGEM
ncbi:MAG: type II secretion system F family protein [Nitratireductor sp.]